MGLGERLTAVLTDGDFKTELEELLKKRGFSEQEAAAGAEELIRACRKEPVDSGLRTSAPSPGFAL